MLQVSAQDSIRHVISDSVQIIEYINNDARVDFEISNNTSYSLLGTLETQSFATIRTGGPSVISTFLHRGMASRHVAVLWGEFNIQSIVNGTYDLSLIRNSFDDAKFYQNGTSALTGNASIAGALSLENKFHSKNTSAIGISATSTKNVSLMLKNKFNHKNYSHHLVLNRTSDKNEYTYKNGGIKLTQSAAKFSIWALNYEGQYLVSNNFSLRGGIWLQNADRNIPPTKTSVGIIQKQKDANYRSFLKWSYYISNDIKLSIRSAYFDELLRYEAPGINSLAESKIINGSVDFIHNSGLTLSTQFRSDQVVASFFTPVHNRKTVAVFGDYKTKINTIEIGLSIRPEWVDNNLQPLIMGVRVSKEFSNSLSSTIRYNKGYTLPSFNDLYWPTGGNPNLDTERSHEVDLGFKYKYGSVGSKSIGLNFYLNLIDDWIQWTPIEGFFQPVNQRKVRNLGFEVKLEESVQVGISSQIQGKLMYSFTDSRLAKHYFNTDNEGKRTVFVPQHKFTGQISWVNPSFVIHIRPLYYSKRYDTVDNSSFVPGYFLAEFEAIKKIKIKDIEINISLAIENSLNNDYENIRFYPMPLRNYRLGANINL